MAPPSSIASQDEAHVVRFEIPPMMRYCAGTCPCTWVTAVALPNIVYLRQFLLQKVEAEGRPDRKIGARSVLTGESREEEEKILDYLVPAQSLMGLSSYFVWYYGHGFYGPAKYPLLLYGLTLACHSVAHEGDIATSPNVVLAHRAACTAGTLLCSCVFLRVSKLSTLLMLPAWGIYTWLTNVTLRGINSGNTNDNEEGSNANNNQAPGSSLFTQVQQLAPPQMPHPTQSEDNNQEPRSLPLREVEKPETRRMKRLPQYHPAELENGDRESSSRLTGVKQPVSPPMKRLPKYHPAQSEKSKQEGKKSILKVDGDVESRNKTRFPQHGEGLSKSNANLSFNDNVEFRYRRLSPSSSSSSSSRDECSDRDVT